MYLIVHNDGLASDGPPRLTDIVDYTPFYAFAVMDVQNRNYVAGTKRYELWGNEEDECRFNKIEIPS